MNDNNIFVCGHKSPDTDSICSAIAYANLKNIIDKKHKYIPCRAGEVNAETEYILNKFSVEKPKLIDTLEPRVRDMGIRTTSGVHKETSIKKTWEKMKKENLRTLPVFDDNKNLIGVVSHGDIASTLMEENVTGMLSKSKVSCRNILDTLNGKLITGSINEVYQNGNIEVGAANPEVMCKNIEPGGMLIVGDRIDTQVSAIKHGVKWLIVCLDTTISKEVVSLAKEMDCIIISTPYSSYRAARLVRQSMPIRHLMFGGKIKSFHLDDLVKSVNKVVSKERIRYFPILDSGEKFVGLISQRNILDIGKHKIILVDHNEETQAPNGIETAEILEIIDHHRIGGITTVSPVYFRNQPVGCSSTIVSIIYEENGIVPDKTMASLMCSAILSDTLCFKSPTCTLKDIEMANKLASIAGITPESHAINMFKAGSDVEKKTAEELFYQDFKMFNIENKNIGAGQVTLVGKDLIEAIEEKIYEYMLEFISKTSMDIILIMLTDVIEEYTRLIYVSRQDKDYYKEIIEYAFDKEVKTYKIDVEGLVSRKKQLIPSLTKALKSKV